MKTCRRWGVQVLGASHLGPRRGFISIAHGTKGSSEEDKIRNIRCRYELVERAIKLGGTA